MHPSSAIPEEIAEILAGDDTISNTSARADLPIAPDMTVSTAIDDMSSLMWRLKVTESGETTFIGPSGNFCFLTDGADNTSLSANPETRHIRHNDGNIPIAYGASPLVKQSLALFAEFINPVHQFMDEDTLAGMEDNLDHHAAFLRSAIVAAGSLYADSIEDQCFGAEEAAKVEADALETCRKVPMLSTIQALTIMCWRELALDNDNMAWMYNGMGL
ncbi:uncharacterized protein N7459_008693 [Penicillium hispanicum]|uniref:uncharacterized protein n=1 Tax=Penicillium hispanicum TaxID=1080232 RepID=UPI0025408092|nr:uncharacterized protein N7459_008693 [Penicillium hispanicum]KAJ5574266.1 hypothetical protein N7459_008693 [Penicillium hispanicum]